MKMSEIIIGVPTNHFWADNCILQMCRNIKTQSCLMFTHHLTQPPQQEAKADIGRSGEVELVTQSRREDKIIHVCSYRAEHRGEVF